MIGIINRDPHSEAIVDQEISVQLTESLASDIKSHQVIDILSLMNLTWPDDDTKKSVDDTVTKIPENMETKKRNTSPNTESEKLASGVNPNKNSVQNVTEVKAKIGFPPTPRKKKKLQPKGSKRGLGMNYGGLLGPEKKIESPRILYGEKVFK